MKVLAIEDSQESRGLISIALSRHYSLEFATTAHEAMRLLKSKPFLAIILDLSLPDGDGLEILSEIQAEPSLKDIPKFILTGRRDSETLMRGLSLGADDFLTKPFEPSELLARIQGRMEGLKKHHNEHSILTVPPFELDRERLQARMIYEDGRVEALRLTPIEFRLLYKFLQNGERIMTRSILIESVWGPKHHIEDRSIDKHISSLRLKLGDYRDCIQTHFGLGYSFESAKPRNAPPVSESQTDISDLQSEIQIHLPFFKESRRSDLNEMRACLLRNDSKRIAQICHNIRGVSEPFGYQDLGNLAALIEQEVQSRQPRNIGPLLDQMDRILSSSRSSIEHFEKAN